MNAEFPLIVVRDHPKRAFREGRWLSVARAVPGTGQNVLEAAAELADVLTCGDPIVEGDTVTFRTPVDHHAHMGKVIQVEKRHGVLFNKRFGKSFFGVRGPEPMPVRETEDDLVFQKGGKKWEFKIDPAETGVGIEKLRLTYTIDGGARYHVGYFPNEYMARRHISKMIGQEAVRSLAARERLKAAIGAEVRRQLTGRPVSGRTFGGRAVTVQERVKAIASPEPGDGINKSKGHLFFHKGYEWFLSPQQNVLRVHQNKAIDPQTGYRKGGREVMPLRLFEPYILDGHGVPQSVWGKTIKFSGGVQEQIGPGPGTALGRARQALSLAIQYAYGANLSGMKRSWASAKRNLGFVALPRFTPAANQTIKAADRAVRGANAQSNFPDLVEILNRTKVALDRMTS